MTREDATKDEVWVSVYGDSGPYATWYESSAEVESFVGDSSTFKVPAPLWAAYIEASDAKWAAEEAMTELEDVARGRVSGSPTPTED